MTAGGRLALLAAEGGSATTGPLALLVVLVLGLVTVLLIRNMDARLRRLPRDFEPPPDDRDPQGPQDR